MSDIRESTELKSEVQRLRAALRAAVEDRDQARLVIEEYRGVLKGARNSIDVYSDGKNGWLKKIDKVLTLKTP